MLIAYLIFARYEQFNSFLSLKVKFNWREKLLAQIFIHYLKKRRRYEIKKNDLFHQKVEYIFVKITFEQTRKTLNR